MLVTVALILLSERYFLRILGYEVAIFLFASRIFFLLSGAAIESLHLENPKSKTLTVLFFLNRVFSIRTFSPTIARSASPLETKEGISSSLTNRISIGRLFDFANNLSPLVEKLIPDFLIKSLL